MWCADVVLCFLLQYDMMPLHHATKNQAGLEVVKALLHASPAAAITSDQVHCEALCVDFTISFL